MRLGLLVFPTFFFIFRNTFNMILHISKDIHLITKEFNWTSFFLSIMNLRTVKLLPETLLFENKCV
jgi:hypothetical protein